jgi:hypothetical protein
MLVTCEEEASAWWLEESRKPGFLQQEMPGFLFCGCMQFTIIVKQRAGYRSGQVKQLVG